MNNFEKYFFSKLAVETNINECYFGIPSNDSFTFLLNELKHIIQLQEDNEMRTSYIIVLSKWFFSFLEKDSILETIDSIDYARLIFMIKQISEGSPINKKEAVSSLKRIKDKNSDLYFKKVIDNLVLIQKENVFDCKTSNNLIELFINETLARNIDIRFIFKTIEWYKDGKFESFEDYLYYFLKQDSDSYDVYIPIKCFKENDNKIFEHHDQKVIDVDGNKYLKIYKNNTIDFYSLISENMMRIESIFNMLKLYTFSSINFDYEHDVLINFTRSKVLKNIDSLTFQLKSIMTYSGVKPYSKFMHQTINNLFLVEQGNRNAYHKVLNVISYSEKDNDFINPTAYVDAWIALETLFSLSDYGKGLDVVKNYLPMFVSSKIIMNKLTFLLKNGYSKICKAEEFVLHGKKINSENSYYDFELEKLNSKFGSVKELSKYYFEIENRIKIDLIRIYMLRNEYVHQSNLNAFRSLQFYKLKNYLTLSIDTFFGMLDKAKRFAADDIIYQVFAKLIQKNTDRAIAFKIETENHKIDSKNKTLKVVEINNDKFTARNLSLNILLNNNAINKPFFRITKDTDN
ncbi:MAG: hypothetical protein WC123_05720 [Bacilli bacterium]